jgi:hypothetical protein
MGYAMAQLVETLRFFRDLWSHYGGVVDSASNRDDCHGCLQGGKDGRCVRLTTLTPSRADCLEILGASTFWNPQALSRSGQACICTYRHRRVGAVNVHLGYGYTTVQWNYIPVLLRELRSSGLLLSKEWEFLSDVSGQHISPIFKGQESKNK